MCALKKSELTCIRKNRSRRLSRGLINKIISLSRLDANGNYYDHISMNEANKQVNKSNLDLLYDAQAYLHSIGNKRAVFKNDLDRQLSDLINTLLEK